MCFNSFFDQFCVKKGRFQRFCQPGSSINITERQVKIEIETNSSLKWTLKIVIPILSCSLYLFLSRYQFEYTIYGAIH